MNSMLPIIPISALQKGAAKVLSEVKDYAVIQSHGRDRAFVLHPDLGRLLLESGMLPILQQKLQERRSGAGVTDEEAGLKDQLEGLIGNVLRELSKR